MADSCLTRLCDMCGKRIQGGYRHCPKCNSARVRSSPAVAGGVVYVGSWDRKVYALNATTGALIWSYTTGDQVSSSAAVAGGVVYVSSEDGKIYAFGPPPLSAAISPSSSTLDVGQSQLFTSSVSGGTSPYTYQWYLNGAAVQNATSSTWTFTPTSAGPYTIYMEVTDSVGGQATSNTATVTVTLHDVASTNATPSKTVVGQGFSTSINVTVANQGDFTETFNVTAYANTTPIGTQEVARALGERFVDLSSSPYPTPECFSMVLEYEAIPKWGEIIRDFRKLLSSARAELQGHAFGHA